MNRVSKPRRHFDGGGSEEPTTKVFLQISNTRRRVAIGVAISAAKEVQILSLLGLKPD